MKTITQYQLERDDPNWQRDVNEAFNRVIHYCPELQWGEGQETQERRTLSRVHNGQFSLNDVMLLERYSSRVRARIESTIEEIMRTTSPECTLLIEELNQAGDNLISVVSSFVEWFQTQLCILV